ncbi:MAG: PEP-CTERM sorting domain-containing protein [Gammaproteobacteria bacterium]|nr:PEP-CTERM sorting domain-containing protein [Gammaproteobacteria bacterium]
MPTMIRALSILVLVAAALGIGVESRAAIQMPAIDELTYDDLVQELRGRIPAHAPEWSNYNESDPGFALLDFFAVIDDLALGVIVEDFHQREWWKTLPIDGEAYLGQLAYSLLEAALTAALRGQSAPDDWTGQYGIDTSLTFAELVARGRAPEPGALALVGLGLVGLYLVARRRRGARRPRGREADEADCTHAAPEVSMDPVSRPAPSACDSTSDRSEMPSPPRSSASTSTATPTPRRSRG